MPADPFEAQAPHLSTKGVSVWLTQPAGMFTRTLVSHLDPGMATFLAKDAMRQLRIQCIGSSPYVFVHDLSSLRSYDTEARNVMTRWAFDVRKEVKLLRIHVGPHAPTLVRMGATVGCTSLAVAGYDIRLVDDLGAEIRRLGLRPRAM